MDIEQLWTSVCSDDQETVKQYYDSGGQSNIRYRKFDADHSLIMGALRNGHMEMVRQLLSYGETVLPSEEREYEKLINDLRRQYYAPEIERLKESHKPLTLTMEIDDDSCTVTSPQFPVFIGISRTVDDAYYELCEWLRGNPEATPVAVKNTTTEK